MAAGARWTDEEDAYLLANFSKQQSVSFLSEVLDRSEDAVKQRYKHLKDLEPAPGEHEKMYILSRANRVRPKKMKISEEIVGARATSKLGKWSGRGNAYANTKTGFRPALGITVRSGWEANVLMLLKSYNIPYEYEPLVFTYPIKRGTKSYTPDIRLPESNGEWIEVKGWLNQQGKTKIKRFKKYYPEEFAKLTMIISKGSKENVAFCEEIGVPNVLDYRQLKKQFRTKVDGWEGK